MSKTEYAYTAGNVGTATKVYNYTYGNAWKDQLTSFDGTAITYDASGNPTNYLGKALTWSRGRLLTKYVSGSKTVEMQYDGNKGDGVDEKKGNINTYSVSIYDRSTRIVSTELFRRSSRFIYGCY